MLDQQDTKGGGGSQNTGKETPLTLGSTTQFLSESKESTYATKRKLPTERAGFPKGISEKGFRNKQLGAQTGNLDSWEEIGSGVKGKHSHRRTQGWSRKPDILQRIQINKNPMLI